MKGHPQISVGLGPEQGPLSSAGERGSPPLTELVRGLARRNYFRVKAEKHV